MLLIDVYLCGRRVLPTVSPGYMRPLLPSEAPEQPEKWQDVMSDIERVIMPGVSLAAVTPGLSGTSWCGLAGYPLALATVPCLLPHGQQLPGHRGGHAERRHRLHRLLLGE